VTRCLLAPEPINICLAQLLDNNHFSRLAEFSEELEIGINPLDNKVTLIFNFTRQPRPADRSCARSLCASIEILERVFFSGYRFAIEGPISDNEDQADNLIGLNLEDDPPMKLFWEVGGFSQVNLKQNVKLINLVGQFSRVDSSYRVTSVRVIFYQYSITA